MYHFISPSKVNGHTCRYLELITNTFTKLSVIADVSLSSTPHPTPAHTHNIHVHTLLYSQAQLTYHSMHKCTILFPLANWSECKRSTCMYYTCTWSRFQPHFSDKHLVQKKNICTQSLKYFQWS